MAPVSGNDSSQEELLELAPASGDITMEAKLTVQSAWQMLDAIDYDHQIDLGPELAYEADTIFKALENETSWPKEIITWVAALETYPKNVYSKKFDLNRTKEIVIRLNNGFSWPLFTPKIVYLNIYSNNDNVIVDFVDCVGEFAYLMHFPNPEKHVGSVWTAKIKDQVWENPEPLSINFWRNWKKQENKVEVIADVEPKIVARSVTKFFEQFSSLGSAPRDT